MDFDMICAAQVHVFALQIELTGLLAVPWCICGTMGHGGTKKDMLW